MHQIGRKSERDEESLNKSGCHLEVPPDIHTINSSTLHE